MEKKDLIQSCRYYKGESECSYRNAEKAMLWDIERGWVADTLASLESGNVGNMGSELDEYLGYGLRTFREDDFIPATLKARLFDRFAKGYYSMADAVAPFKQFYTRYY